MRRTSVGRVVYNRRVHFFTPRSVLRIVEQMKNDYLDPKYIPPFAFSIPRFYVSILLQAFEDAADPSEGLRIAFESIGGILKDLVAYAIKNNQAIAGGIYGILMEILDLLDRRD